MRPTIAQGTLAKQQVQVQPSNMSVQTSPTRHVQTGTGPMRQISRVQGVKAASRPQPAQAVQRRIAPQPAKPGLQNSTSPPMVVVQPKVQQIAPKAKKTASTSTSTSAAPTRHQPSAAQPTENAATQHANPTTANNPQDVPSCDDSEKDDEDFEDDEDDNNQDADEEDIGIEEEAPKTGRNEQVPGKKDGEATGPWREAAGCCQASDTDTCHRGLCYTGGPGAIPCEFLFIQVPPGAEYFSTPIVQDWCSLCYRSSLDFVFLIPNMQVQRSSVMNEILGCKPVNPVRDNDSDLDRDSAMDLGEGTNSETDSMDRAEDGNNENCKWEDEVAPGSALLVWDVLIVAKKSVTTSHHQSEL